MKRRSQFASHLGTRHDWLDPRRPTPHRGAGCSLRRRARSRGAAGAHRRLSLAERQPALDGGRQRDGVRCEWPVEHHIVPHHRRHTLATRRAGIRGVQRRVRPLSLANRRRYAPAAGADGPMRRTPRRAGRGMDPNDRGGSVRPVADRRRHHGRAASAGSPALGARRLGRVGRRDARRKRRLGRRTSPIWSRGS